MRIPAPLEPVASIRSVYPEDIVDVVEFRDETTLVVKAESIVSVMRYLRDTNGLIYNYLSDISAVDYYEPSGGYGNRPERFGVSYHLYSMLYNRRIRVKVYLSEEDLRIASIVPVWPAANWLEREIFDMMGVQFDGHPDMRRVLMPQDWDGHPHRRDYPLGYEQPMFSFNVEDIMKHKPLAEE